MKTAILIAFVSTVLCGLMAGLAFSQAPPASSPPATAAERPDDGLSRVPATPGELIIRGKDGKPAGVCPLKHTDVKAEIAGFIARVTVTQEFSNPTTSKIEAVYTFPLAEDAAVDRMEMTIGKRTIEGEVHRREEAREIYEAAREAGHVASLLDQERPNIFTQAVANIMPGEKVKITISYTQLLKYEAGVYDFAFPMVVGPRFVPGQPTGAVTTGTGTASDTMAVPDASRISPPVAKNTRAGHDISIRVEIEAGVPMNWVNCPTHDIDCDYPTGNSAVVTLRDQEAIPNKDFLIKYEVASDQIRSGLITSAPGGQGGFFTLIMQPPKAVNQAMVTPKEMIFVIDRSGSQQGEPIKKSVDTMLHCIRNVNPGDTFNMISFANDMTTLFDAPKEFSAETEAAAVKFLSEIKADGGTVLMPALEAALKPPADPKRLRIVVFFTDGQIGNDFEALQAVQKNLGSARLFSFGIGSSPNRFLIEKMAEEGRGASEIVLLEADSKLVAERFYNRIRNPVLTDISIDWGGLPVAKDEVYPKLVPDLFSSQPLVLKGCYDRAATGKITIHGKLNGQPWSQTLEANLPKSRSDNDSLATIWARARIDDLMSKDWMGAQTGNGDPNIKDDIVNVALQYNLMTQYTSFVAVEKMVVTQGGKSVTVAVPVEMPEGAPTDGLAMAGDALVLAQPVTLGTTSLSYYRNAAPAPPALTPAAPTSLGRHLSTASSAGYGAVAKGGVAGKPTRGVTTNSSSKSAGRLSNMAVEEKLADWSCIDGAQVVRPKPKLDASLTAMLENYKARKTGPKSPKKYTVPAKIVVQGNRVQVMVWLNPGGKDKLAQLTKLGFVDRSWVISGKALIGWLPIDSLEKAGLLEFVSRISTPQYAK